MVVIYWYFFFFQADDGIRDRTVTGVQTCALPIWMRLAQRAGEGDGWLTARIGELGPDQVGARPRQIASSRLPPTAPNASVRATMTKSGSWRLRTSTAARY